MFAVRNLPQPLDDQRDGDAFQIEPLAAGDDRRQDFMRLRRREKEFHMLRRLLQRLQEGVPRLRRQHVDFVDDVDFVFAVDRRVLHVFADVADMLHLVVRRAVDFNHIHGRSGRHFTAALALAARFAIDVVRAIQSLCENSRRRRLANSARTDKQIRMADAVLDDRIPQRPADMLLPDYFRKCLRTPFSRQNLIRHDNFPLG